MILSIIDLSVGLDPDQDQHFVGPDLGPDRLQRLSELQKMTKFAASKERVNDLKEAIVYS